MLPSGPHWKYVIIQPEYPTKKPLRLFFQDPLECLQALLLNPKLAAHIEFCPRKLYETADATHHVYKEWLTGDHTWELQVTNMLFYHC